jgi:site-specific DNA recombinase
VRLISACRLSRDTEVSTSIERQDEGNRRWANGNGHTVIATTEDTDVSGAISPFDRPDLGPWFGRKDEWDGIIVAKLDRISRSIVDFGNLIKWMQDNGKTLIVLDPMIDLSTPWGQAMANVLMTFAQLERQLIGLRVSDSRVKLRSNAWWPGGAVPPGYQVVKYADHNELVPDPDQAAIIRRIAALIIKGTSARQIAAMLNAEGIATSKGNRWDGGSLIKIMRNQSLRGYVTHNDEIVRGDDGMPVTREAILDDETWLKVQAQLDKNAKPGSGVRKSASLLTGILHCADCGKRLYIHRRSNGDRYRHGDGSQCNASYSARQVDQATEHTLLGYTDELPMMIRAEIPAENHTVELGKVQQSIDELDEAFERGSVTAETYGRMTTKLEARRDELKALPVSEAREEWTPTDEMFADHYRALDTEGRHQLLMSFGVRVDVCRETSDSLTVDPVVTSGWRQAHTVKIGKSIIKTDCGKVTELRERAQAA